MVTNSKMWIGELATLAGMTVDAIRFYEKAGLLGKPARTEGGYRQYGKNDAESILFIKRVQELGFSLKQIREFLILHETKPDCCSDVRHLFQEKLRGVREKQRQLKVLEKDLESSLKRCNRQLRGSAKGHVECPVLEQLHITSKGSR